MSDGQPSVANSEKDDKPSLPLEELELTPQWVKSVTPSFRDHTGEDRGPRKRDRGFRDQDRDRGPRPDRPPRAKAGGPDRPQKRGVQPHRDRQRAPQPQPPREITAPVEVAFLPEEKGFAAMLATMKESRRAYALFDLAKLVLNKPERHQVKLVRKPAADGTRAPLYVVTATEGVFFSTEQALRSIFQHHAALVCKETKTTIDPPKGNFVFVSRCGFTGEILGPPNYHEYQSRIVRHHQERLRHVSFEEFKSRIQSVKDPEAVKAWAESLSTKTEYECILDAEPKKFATREELHRHVATEHLDKLVGTVPEAIISGPASRKLEHPGILEAIREAWVSERRFPLKTANGMQTRLRREGFSFFKHRKGITYISAVKPKRFEAGQTLTEHVQKIIAFVRANEGCTRKQLLDNVLPSSTPGTPAAGQEQLLADLHWLIQDAYVMEFHNGGLIAFEDRPPKPQPAAQIIPESKPTPSPSQEANSGASSLPSDGNTNATSPPSEGDSNVTSPPLEAPGVG